MEGPRVLLVDNYDSYSWNLVHLLWSVSGVRPVVVRNDEADAAELLRQDFSHVVISPGPGSPTRTKDFGLCAELLQRVRVPCLGVCLGHQGLAAAFGGTVEHAPEIVHGGLSRIMHTGAGLFAGLPDGFAAVRYHSLAVRGELPPELAVTAWTDTGVIMGLRHKDRPLSGVQFHPESVATEHGAELIANFLGQHRLPATAQASSPAASALRSDAGARPATASQRRPSSADAPRLRWTELDVEVSAEAMFHRAFATARNAFWLDSARSAYGMGRHSYLGASEGAGSELLRAFAGANSVESWTPAGVRRSTETLFEHLRAALDQRSVDTSSCPVPFTGGYLGYLGYGLKGSVGIGRAGRGERPDAELLWVDRYVAFDHETNRRYLITVGLAAAEHRRWCAKMRRAAARPRPTPSAPTASRARMTAGVDPATYRADYETVQGWLRDGDSYEACYTYQLTGTTETDPLTTYGRLRAENPAPYAAYLRFGDRAVLSSSPERFVAVDPDGWAETKPIKGTAARSADPLRDAAVARQLGVDPKLRSENLMITDLLRNDLSRVCEAGTVAVPSLMAVESYSTVHQLVTTIRGRLRSGLGAVDCVEALFPAGSMTGAPKLRTVELLDELETAERGIYAGCVGFFGLDGAADLSVVIRTIVWEDEQVRIGVGGAIIVLSDPAAEYEETRLKAHAPLRALGAEDTGTSDHAGTDDQAATDHQAGTDDQAGTSAPPGRAARAAEVGDAVALGT